MPPQGLLLIVAYMPAHWPVAFASLAAGGKTIG
jgi:hypothetical protein